MLSLLTRTKSFRDPWVGQAHLNSHWRLHRRRMQLAEALCRWRRGLRPPSACSGLTQADLQRLQQDGCLEIRDFLPQELFSALLADVEQLVTISEDRHPLQRNSRVGFQPKQPFPGGFDRFDGGTLNRFLHLEAARIPDAALVCRDQRLNALSRQVIGLPMDPHKLDIYVTVHGEQSSTPDLQKELHRDTFFRALKFWLFLHPVDDADGPFEYVPGSHRLDAARLRWEQDTADAAVIQQRQPDVSGSFRIHEDALADLGLPPPHRFTCPANTLVLADVLGFHRRGDASPGRRRLALYGWNRPYPFLPLSW